MRSNWKPISYTKEGDYFSVVVRYRNKYDFVLDVKIDEKYKDVNAEWNQYIFNLEDPIDVMRSAVQEDNDNYDEASSLAICALEEAGEIYQDDQANWYMKAGENN